MSNQIVIKDERYERLLEEIDATFVEGKFNARLTLIETHHAIGRAMVKYIEDNQVSPTSLVKEVAQDLNQSERGVWDVYRIAKDHPSVDSILNALGGGKNVSWTRARNELLGSGEEPTFNLERAVESLLKKYGKEKSILIAEAVLQQGTDMPVKRRETWVEDE